ncbi:MAG: isoprenyl transferase [Candidatus Atribacteria bacterium]|nr:isoprenyl transferase [Candidatus Atribacteria bacterium]
MLQNKQHTPKTINNEKLVPNHLAVIMDGNGRWAKKHNLPRFAGHQAGLKTAKMVISESLKAGIKILTLYSFSTENWQRSKNEVNSLMNLFREAIKRERKNLINHQIRIKFIGDKGMLSETLRSSMQTLEMDTENNSRLFLNIAINYGGRDEIYQAFISIYKNIIEGKINSKDISQDTINQYLYTSGLADPDLLIRTGGEKRLSNFLLWQVAYTELWFSKTFWPDFTKENLWKAFYDYQKRVRKFGREV